MSRPSQTDSDCNADAAAPHTAIPVEPITTEKYARDSVVPILYEDVWSAFKSHEESAWRAEEIVELGTDLIHWTTVLSDDDRHFLEHILAFFAVADAVVNEHVSNVSNEITMPEARHFYSMQAHIENVHAETYGILVRDLITDAKKRQRLLNATQTMPCIAKKMQWAKQWMNSETQSLAARMVGIAVMEGVFFSGAFCSIYWLGERRVMPGLRKANEWIARDEGLHTQFAYLIYNKYIEHKLTQEELHRIVREAVDIEIEFICVALPCSMLGMNSRLMGQYVRFVANALVVSFKCDPLYPGVECPFDFMTRISTPRRTNFFERAPTDYSKKGKAADSTVVNDDVYADL